MRESLGNTYMLIFNYFLRIILLRLIFVDGFLFRFLVIFFNEISI